MSVATELFRMLIFIIVAVLLGLNFGCGTELDRDFIATDLEFTEYVESFSLHYGAPINNTMVVIGFEDEIIRKGMSMYGICSYPRKQVTISRKFWDSASDIKKELLIYHELGHCILKRRGHTSGTVLVDGRVIIKSVMNLELVSDTAYRNHKDYYINELFNR